MKNLAKWLCAAALAVTPAMQAADYPTAYLRGDISGGWAAKNEYKFNVSNDGVYTLHVDDLWGQFKIASEDWSTVDFGGDGSSVSDYGFYAMKHQGANYKVPDGVTLHNVDFVFRYIPGAAELVLSIVVDGKGDPNPPAPEPEKQTSGTLPVLYINVYTDETHTTFNNEINSRDLAHKDYFSFSEYWLDVNGCQWMIDEFGAKSVGSKDEPLPLEIKARGNWTRVGFSKKPFKLKLGKKQSLLGMSKSKHYAILAHADDYWGYLRNFTGFNLGQRIGLPWTPSQQPVEVVVNGDYRGLYFLTESIRIEDGRIEINELADNCEDPSLASGGYLVELDNYDEENQIRLYEKTCVHVPFVDMLRITFDTPEFYSDLQRRFVKEQFEAMNDAVGACSDNLWSYMDLDDAARYYIVEEILSHTESYHGSTYMFRDRGEGQKWHFSPLWDCGNAFSGPNDDWFCNHGPFGNTWIPSMRANATFMDKVRDTWRWFMSQRYDGIYDDIRTYAARVKEAAQYDYNRWKAEPTPANGQQVADNRDMDARRDAVLGKLVAKTQWLAGQWGDHTGGTYTEPERDNTSAAPLPGYVSGVENIVVSEEVADGPATYYDLRGIRISKPTRGQIYIRATSTGATLCK